MQYLGNMDRSSGGGSLTGTDHRADRTVQTYLCSGTHVDSWHHSDPADTLEANKLTDDAQASMNDVKDSK